MPFFLVKLRREIEWENVYEAQTYEEATDLARLEAHHGTVVDEQVIVEEVQPAEQVD